MFTKKEAKHLVISIIILGLVFGFDDGKSRFQLGYWLTNLVFVTLLVAFSIMFREMIVKWKASRHDAQSEYEVWIIKQVWFGGHGKLKRGLPLGIFISLLLSITSRGKAFFTAIGVHKIKENLVARAGRKRVYIKDWELAQIGMWSIWANVLLVIVGVFLKNYGITINKFIEINMFIALFNMLPFGDLDGAKIFFGNLFLYIFNLTFLIITFLLVKQSLLLSLIIAFIIAITAGFLWHYFYEYK